LKQYSVIKDPILANAFGGMIAHNYKELAK